MQHAPLQGNRLTGAFAGHLWTLVPHLRNRFKPPRAPADTPWSMTVQGPQLAAVQLTGALCAPEGADTVAVIIHGLGGNGDAGYCLEAAAAVARVGWASLRLHLRGTDGEGADLYHAGLGSDIAAALKSPELQNFRRVVIIGFSLGGHIALCHALDPDPRLVAVTAVCSPLDLHQSSKAIDRRRALLYRRHVLRELKSAYRPVAQRHATMTPMAVVDKIKTIRQWDTQVVVPRFGFADVAAYYNHASVGPRLSELEVPSLYIGAPFDPMVPPFTVQSSLDGAASALEVRWVANAGHVGFANANMIDQIVAWTQARAAR